MTNPRRSWSPSDSETLKRKFAEDRCRREVRENRDEATAIGIGLVALLGATVSLTLVVHSLEWAWRAFTR